MPDLRIWLNAPIACRAKRIATRDGMDEYTAREVTLQREESERKRYRNYYKIEIDDLSPYHLAMNSELWSSEALAAIVDLQRKTIPNWLTVPGLVWVLGSSAILGWPRLADALFGLLFCGGVLLILAVISRGSIGGGDVKLMAMIGALLGWRWGFGVLAAAEHISPQA
jgi:hypothetical protein